MSGATATGRPARIVAGQAAGSQPPAAEQILPVRRRSGTGAGKPERPIKASHPPSRARQFGRRLLVVHGPEHHHLAARSRPAGELASDAGQGLGVVGGVEDPVGIRQHRLVPPRQEKIPQSAGRIVGQQISAPAPSPVRPGPAGPGPRCGAWPAYPDRAGPGTPVPQGQVPGARRPVAVRPSQRASSSRK